MLWLGGRARRVRLALATSSVWLAVAASAHAGPGDPDGSNVSRAHDAYARGAAAYTQGDYARAARELAFADGLVPDAVTLRAALDAVTLADDPVLGSELLARARRDPGEPALAHAAAVAAERFAHRTGTIVVRCDDCLALIDGAPARVAEPNVVLPGVHTVTVQRRRSPESRLVSVAADETREVLVHNREPMADHSAPAPAPEATGLSPVWFVAAVGATLALGAVTVWSAVDTASDHSSFESARCPQVGTVRCASLASSGEAAQTRTGWLTVGSAAAALGTAALGGFGVRWHGARPGAPEVAAFFRASSATVRFAF